MLEFNKENLIEAIRFDVDYHCPFGRETHPAEGKIDKSLHDRLKKYSEKEDRRFPIGMRRRIFTLFGVKGTIENHQLFDEAVQEFSSRLNRQGRTVKKKRPPQKMVAFS